MAEAGIKKVGWTDHPHGKADKRGKEILCRLFFDVADEKHYIDIVVPFFEFQSGGVGYGAYGQRLTVGGNAYRLGLTISDPATIPEPMKEKRRVQRALEEARKFKSNIRIQMAADLLGVTEEEAAKMLATSAIKGKAQPQGEAAQAGK